MLLTLYLSSLVVGGTFVALSSLGGFGRSLDADVDADVDVDVDVDADADVDVDADHALEAGHALALADGSHGLAPRPAKKKLWLPVLSFRFWTFGAAFFGLTGTLLTSLTGAGPIVVAMLSAGVGVGVGTLSAGVVRWLRKPVGETVRKSDYIGQAGELTLPLRKGGVTRIRLRVKERERSMLAMAPEPLALPAGTRVVVLGIDGDGKAQIVPEDSVFRPEDQ